jgi:hypothetical protein
MLNDKCMIGVDMLDGDWLTPMPTAVRKELRPV